MLTAPTAPALDDLIELTGRYPAWTVKISKGMWLAVRGATTLGAVDAPALDEKVRRAEAGIVPGQPPAVVGDRTTPR